MNFINKVLLKILSKITLKNAIALESNSDFCDSSKTFYDYLIKNGYNKKYKIYWFVNKPSDFKKYKLDNVKFISRARSIRSLFIKKCSEYCVYTHRFLGNQFNKKQKRVFVTHAAMPIKNSTGCFWDARFNTQILGTSEMCVYYRNKCLGGENKNFSIIGLPRNDDLFVTDKSILSKLDIPDKFILWMPTFKHHKVIKRNDYKQNVSMDVSLLTYENLEKLNRILQEKNMTLVIKPHPAQDLEFLKVTEMSNIRLITNEILFEKSISLYQFMALSTALITDFSSVFLDYLLINKPIGFELADQETYKKGVGYIMDNPEDFMPGQKIYSLADFVDFIDNLYHNKDDYKNEREELCKKVHKYLDNNSSERLCKLLGLNK